MFLRRGNLASRTASTAPPRPPCRAACRDPRRLWTWALLLSDQCRSWPTATDRIARFGSEARESGNTRCEFSLQEALTA